MNRADVQRVMTARKDGRNEQKRCGGGRRQRPAVGVGGWRRQLRAAGDLVVCIGALRLAQVDQGERWRSVWDVGVLRASPD